MSRTGLPTTGQVTLSDTGQREAEKMIRETMTHFEDSE